MDELPRFLKAGAQFTYVDSGATYLVLDFETTNLDKGSALNPNNRLVLACWYTVTPDGTVAEDFVYGDEYQMDKLVEAVKSVDFIVAQGGKFELQWLKRLGIDLRDILVFDTMLAAWVLDGNRMKPRNLDALAARLGIAGKESLVSKLIKAGVCPSTIKKEWLIEYCFRDIHITRTVFLAQRTALQRNKQLHLVHTRNLTSAVLADIEFEGLHLDPEAVEAEYTKTLAEWKGLGSRLYELTGGINLDSPKQLSEYIFGELGFKIPKDYRGKEMLTASGQPSTNADTISKLVAKTDKQKVFLELYEKYNLANTLLSKNLTFMRKVCEEYGGTFYGSFNLGIAGTHRLTSSGRPLLFEGEKKARGIQLQNIPRQYKRLFWSGDEDYEVVEGDGAQLEFRVAADLGNDEVAKHEIATDADVHSITANFLLDHGYPGFDSLTAKERRQGSKQYTFKPLYGGGAGHDSVVKYCEFFKEKYKSIAETQYGWSVTALNTKKQVTPYGMVFYWPTTSMSRSGYITNTTQIYNYPVQGFATGEIIPIALVHFWHRARDKRIRIFTTIHDSIAAYVHKDDVEICRELMKTSLTDDVYRYLREIYDYEFTTPLGVGVKNARNWGTSKTEYMWNVFPDGTFTFTEK